MSKPDIRLTRAQLERTWQLTLALAQNDSAGRRTLDQLFLHAAKFVERVDGAVDAGQLVELDTGRGDHARRVLNTLAVEG